MAKTPKQDSDDKRKGEPPPTDEPAPGPPPEPSPAARAAKAEAKAARAQEKSGKKGKKGKKLSKKERRAAAVHAVATRLKESSRSKSGKKPDVGFNAPSDAAPAGTKRKDETKKKDGAKQKAETSKQEDAQPAAAPVPVDPDAVAAALVVGEGFDLAAVDASATPGFDGDKTAAAAAMAAVTEELADLQERLYAHGKDGGSRSLLLLVQGMDTSGKGGIMRHVAGAMDPQGVRLTAFKAPTKEEKAKGYLWRIRQALPEPGYVGVFDRSQYEDVLPVRVLNLAPRSVWGRRYNGINTFEAQQVNRGMTVVKVMLHISKDEQGRRLAERIERPDKHWKYNPGDIDNRRLWDEYLAAYQELLEKCSTPNAPWYVVPADRKWYARLAVQQLVLKALREMELGWPPAHFDQETERQRLAES